MITTVRLDLKQNQLVRVAVEVRFEIVFAGRLKSVFFRR